MQTILISPVCAPPIQETQEETKDQQCNLKQIHLNVSEKFENTYIQTDRTCLRQPTALITSKNNLQDKVAKLRTL